jgi:hypothetical protein
MMLLDEPTNHLDIEAIDSLAEAIKGFKVGPCYCYVLLRYMLRLVTLHVLGIFRVCCSKTLDTLAEAKSPVIVRVCHCYVSVSLL